MNRFFSENNFSLLLKRARTALVALLLWPAALAAQNGITVSGLVANAGTVTFNLSWEKTAMPAAWSDTVWVFVDYNVAGKMQRLPLLPGATLTAASPGGKIIEAPGNNKGVWVAGNARTQGRFSATVQLLTAATGVSGACAYASNYPPVGKYNNGSSGISFTGTAPFTLTITRPDGNTETMTTGSTCHLPQGFTLESFTDATGAPGMKVMDCLNPATFTLTTSASGSSFCTSHSVGITFALSGTEKGRNYQLFRDAAPVGMLTGTGSAATFSGTYDASGVYTAASMADHTHCPLPMNGSHAIVVSPLPEGLALTAAPGVICNGQSATLTASATGGALFSLDNHTWQASPVFSVSPSANTSYTLYVKAPAGCLASAVNAAAVEVTPAFAITTQPSGMNICAGSPAQLSVAATGAAQASVLSDNVTSYQWLKDGANVVDGDGGTLAYYTTGQLHSNATYTVVVSNGACSVTSAVALVTVSTPPAAPTGLTSDIPTICNGVPTVMTLTATGGSAGSGAVYEWGTGNITGNNPLSPATTTAGIRTVNPSTGTIYWVRLRGTGACSNTVTGGAMVSIGTNPAFSPGAIQSGSTVTLAGTAPNIIIGSVTPATGSNIIYEWRLQGAGAPVPAGGSAATFAINTGIINYTTPGTYAFNRYAKDAACNGAWMAASGTYILKVKSPGPPGNVPTKVCKNCCWDGATWVDCHVTVNVYPFDTDLKNTKVQWASPDAYNQKARSDRDGRANTNAVPTSSAGTYAVQLCKDLGEGWYLPAYEELVNMSNGRLNTPLNGLSGARLLSLPADSYYWSSTEAYENGGRFSSTEVSLQTAAVMVYHDAYLSYNHKHYRNYVRCAWRD